MKTYTLTAEQMQQVRKAAEDGVKREVWVCERRGADDSGALRRSRAALALLDAAMQAPEATDREGWLTREEIANLSRPLPAGEKWATIPEAELQALCRMALFALSVPAEATDREDANSSELTWELIENTLARLGHWYCQPIDANDANKDFQRARELGRLLNAGHRPEATAGGDVREAAYRLSTWAACVRWDGGHNERDWLDGLRERIEKVQALEAALAAAPKPQDCPHGCEGTGLVFQGTRAEGPCPRHGTKPEAPTDATPKDEEPGR